MKSSSNQAAGLPKKHNFVIMLVAVLAATIMWYVVSVRDRLEAQIEVNIDYYGIPPNLVVTAGLVNKIIVRLRGSETLLRAMSKERINEAIDLSNIKKGTTVVPLGGKELEPKLRAFEVVDIQPPSLKIEADTLMERSVPVRAVVDSPLMGEALTVDNVATFPSTVTLRGPETKVSDLTFLEVHIPVDSQTTGRVIEKTMTLDTPSLVTASPASVVVRYTVTSARIVISRKCPISIMGDVEHHYEVKPHELTVLVEVPEALSNNKEYLGKLEATVVPPPLAVGGSKMVKVRFQTPEGMTLLHQADDQMLQVMVTKIQ